MQILSFQIKINYNYSGVGDEEIVSNDLNLGSNFVRHLGIMGPVVLIKGILNGDYWIL